MVATYVPIARRNFKKNKAFSLIITLKIFIQYACLINFVFDSYIDLSDNLKLNVKMKGHGIISEHDPLHSLNFGLVYKFKNLIRASTATAFLPKADKFDAV